MSMLVGQEAPMTDQNFERGESYDWAEHETSNKKMRDAASEAFDKAADTARDCWQESQTCGGGRGVNDDRPRHGHSQ